MTHSDPLILSARDASRWMRCPGSVALSRATGVSASASDAESQAAHRLAAWCLETGLDAGDWPHGDIRIGGERFAPAGDLARHVMTYVQLCHPVMLEAADHAVDKRVDFTMATGQSDGFGVADFVAVGQSQMILVDFDYGNEAVTAAEDNAGLQFLALGALETYGLIHDIATVRLVVCQPRLRHRAEWRTTPAALKQFAETARARASQALQPDAAEAFLNPGDAQCRGCPARAACPALTQAVLATVAGDDDLAALLPKLDMIEDWCDAVRVRAREHLQAGGAIAGYRLAPGRRSVRAWSSAGEAESVMKSMRLRQEEMYDLSLISPPMAERLLKDTPKRWARLTPLITQRDGLPVVVRDDTDKPAVPEPAAPEPAVPEPVEAAWI